MSSAPDPSREYLKSAVMTASPEQLQLMLIDGAIRFATRGLTAIREKNIEAAFNALERAQRIALELSNGLRREVNPQLVDQMSALYGYIFRRLVDANVQRDPQAAEDALRILRHQRETWALLIDKLNNELSTPQPSAARPDSAAASPDTDEPSGFVAEA